MSDTDRLLPSLFSVYCSQLHKDIDYNIWAECCQVLYCDR